MLCFSGAIDKLRAAWPCSVSKRCHNMFRTAKTGRESGMGRNQCEYLCFSNSGLGILMGAPHWPWGSDLADFASASASESASAGFGPRLIALQKPFAFNWPPRESGEGGAASEGGLN